MKKHITQSTSPMLLPSMLKIFILNDNPEGFSRKYLAVPVLLTAMLLLSAGCGKPSNPIPEPAATIPWGIVTDEVYAKSQTTGRSGGDIYDDGGATITARGICWSTTIHPTIANFKTNAGTGTGIFTSFATGLTPATTYYVRAYATNSAGTAYGDNEVSFTTSELSDTTVTDIDGYIYHTITIGTQVWTIESLKTEHYQNGDEMPYGFNDGMWQYNASNSIGSYTINPTAGQGGGIYGKLYNWFAVADPRNIAPVGWHVPTETEWNTLTTFLGGSNTAGVKMKEAGLSNWVSPNTGATNSSGFTGLPGGYRNGDGGYNVIGNAGWWWSTTESFAGSDEAKALGLFTDKDEANIVDGKKAFGSSIRCIKN